MNRSKGGGYTDDAPLTAILGPRCPDCGWRGGRHRPAIGDTVACPQWVAAPASSEEE